MDSYTLDRERLLQEYENAFGKQLDEDAIKFFEIAVIFINLAKSQEEKGRPLTEILPIKKAE